MPAPRLAPLAVPVAVAVAGATVAALHGDRSAATSTCFFAWFAAGALAPLAATAPRTSRIVPAAGVAVVAALAFLPRTTPFGPAALGVVLVAALGFTLAERALSARNAQAIDPPSILGLALGAQWLASGEALALAPLGAATVVRLVVAPLAVTLALVAVARRRGASALALGCGTLAAGSGWGGLGTFATLAAAAAIVALAERRRPLVEASIVAVGVALAAGAERSAGLTTTLALAAGLGALGALAASDGRGRRPGAVLLAFAAALALVAGGFPWLARSALPSAIRFAWSPVLPGLATPIAGAAVVVSAQSPRHESALGVGRRGASGARGLRIVSYLTHAVALPCGTPLARLTLAAGDDERAAVELVAGRDSADWASRRPDVEPRLACAAPEPLWSWIPGEGRFLGSSYGARFEWAEPVDADRLRIERDPRLPESVALALFFVGVER